MTACWVDGVESDSVPASDRGLLYGDGLFETVIGRDGAPRFLGLHLQRLREGCRVLGLPEPDLDALGHEIRRACAVSYDCIVRLTLTRGSSATRGYAPPVPAVPRRILVRHLAEPSPLDAAGIRACHSTVVAGSSPALAGIKHLNRLENVLARARLAGTGCDEAVMSTVGGELVGGTMSNLFVVLGGQLLTPPVAVAGIRGVMRAVVLREAAIAGIAALERPLRRADLAAASEIFFTNVRVGPWPVRELEAWRGAAPGPLAGLLRQRIDGLRD